MKAKTPPPVPTIGLTGGIASGKSTVSARLPRRGAARRARGPPGGRARPPPPPAIVLDAAILFQAGWERLCDRVWAVSASDAAAIARLPARKGLSEEQGGRR